MTIPDSVTWIFEDAFKDCVNLTSVTIPDSVTEIDRTAFDGTPFLKNLGDFAVVNGILLRYQGSGGAVTIPDNVTRIGNCAFQDCTSLTSVTIPDGVTSIGYSAFSGCTGLTSLTIPENITELTSDMFAGTPWLKNLGDLAIVNGILLRYQGSGGHVVIPDGVTCIEGHMNWTYLFDGAFSGCTGVTSVDIPDSVTVIGAGAFMDCTGLTSVDIPSSVTEIGCCAFLGCTSLTGVTIPNGVTYLGETAQMIGVFTGCSSLTNVTIPSSVTYIGMFVFDGCTSLKDVYYGGSEAQWNAISMIEDNVALKSATIHFNSTGPALTATPTNDKLSVDGRDATPAAYKIGGANYFKLRDVAMMLSGTKAQFSIAYDGEKKAIMITTGQPYQPVGGELDAVPSAVASAMTSNDAVYINGERVNLTAYKINNANYYGIRELAQKLGFNVGWTGERGMFIESDKPYTDAD